MTRTVAPTAHAESQRGRNTGIMRYGMGRVQIRLTATVRRAALLFLIPALALLAPAHASDQLSVVPGQWGFGTTQARLIAQVYEGCAPRCPLDLQ